MSDPNPIDRGITAPDPGSSAESRPPEGVASGPGAFHCDLCREREAWLFGDVDESETMREFDIMFGYRNAEDRA